MQKYFGANVTFWCPQSGNKKTTQLFSSNGTDEYSTHSTMSG